MLREVERGDDALNLGNCCVVEQSINSDYYSEKTLHFWSLKCPHVQSLRVCTYSMCKHTLTLGSRFYGEPIADSARIFIQNCFIAYCQMQIGFTKA